MRSPLFYALVALAILLAVMESVWPGFFLHDDNASWFAGAYAQDFRTLTQTGELAQVNFYQYGGEPFVEQGQTAVLYPLVYVAAALAALWPGDLRWTVDWLAAIHLALAVTGFYAWMRRGPADGSRVDARLAALGGLAWALNPFVLLLGASWIMVTAAAAWLPWLFWGVDIAVSPGSGRRLTLPGALPLGIIAGLFVLQGYVQWAAYAFLFAGMYAAYWIFVARERLRPLVALGFAGLIALAVAMPQVLPLMRGAAVSKTRAEELSPMFELFYRVQPDDLLAAQFGFFRQHFMFGASTALFFCPALVLLPVAAMAFVRGDEAARRRLFPLILLALIALFFSGRGYFLLNVVPFMAKFRWPFKVFLFAEFFFIAALVRGIAVWGGRREGAASGGYVSLREGTRTPTSPVPGVHGLTLILVGVIVLQVGVVLWGHTGNLFSVASLPASQADVPVEMNPALGRVIAVGRQLPLADAHRHLTHAYSTYYQMPSLGGYDPLVSRASLAFGLNLDVPNFCNQPVSQEMFAQLESRAVRYWIVNGDSTDLLPHADASGPMGSPATVPFNGINGFRFIARDLGRSIMVLEDTHAAPLAYAEAAPETALPVRYRGNAMLVHWSGGAGTVAVSVQESEDWWYRVDDGKWQQSGYAGDRLRIPIGAGIHELEIHYFDSYLWRGFHMSLILICLIAIGLYLLAWLGDRGR